MKQILLYSFFLFGIIATAQKLDLVTYEQLTNPEQAKNLNRSIEFNSIEMPDGSILKIGDTFEFGEQSGALKRKYKGVLENVYSTLKYGGDGQAIIYSPDAETNDTNYIFTAEKGKNVEIFEFKTKRKLDGTFFVRISLKPLEGIRFIEKWKRARASLESFETGELVKVQ